MLLFFVPDAIFTAEGQLMAAILIFTWSETPSLGELPVVVRNFGVVVVSLKLSAFQSHFLLKWK